MKKIFFSIEFMRQRLIALLILALMIGIPAI